MTSTQQFTRPAVRDDWLAQSQESAIWPDLLIVDAHHHLFDRPGNVYLVEAFAQDLASGHNVVATVYVQARTAYLANGDERYRPVGETSFAAKAAQSGRICTAIVAFADLGLGIEVGPVLDAHLAAAGGRLRGVRQIATWDKCAGLLNPAYPTTSNMLASEEFRAGFAQLGSRGLSFDAWIFFHQIPLLTDLAQAFPEVSIILDHCGGILGIGPYRGQRDQIFAEWRRSMTMLAKCPNVCVKLGGLGMNLNGFGFESQDHAPSSETLAVAWRPYFETCITLFGTDRCMFESNFPVDKGSYSYANGWNAMKRIVEHATAAEVKQLFETTAKRAYQLDPK